MLTGVTHDMRIMREEIFGPVVPVIAIDDEDEAVALANDSEFGLGASVWTMDRPPRRADRAPARERDGVGQRPHVLARGVLVLMGRREALRPRPLALEVRLLRVREREARSPGSPSRTRNFWWQPYDESLGRAMHASAQLLYGRDSDKAPALRRGLRPLLKVGRRALRDVMRR